MDFDDQRRNCPGFLDQYGIWNNGFECPSLSNEIHVCCGSDSYRYCCLLEYISNNSSKRTYSNSNDLFKQIFRWNFRTFFILLFILLIIIMIIIICYRRRHRFERKSISNKEIFLSNYFPFSPPHHQIYSNDINQLNTICTSNSCLPIESINIYPNRSSKSCEKYQQQENFIV